MVMTRALIPLRNPANPWLPQSSRATSIDDGAFPDRALITCSLVLTTSMGWVTMAATAAHDEEQTGYTQGGNPSRSPLFDVPAYLMFPNFHSYALRFDASYMVK